AGRALHGPPRTIGPPPPGQTNDLYRSRYTAPSIVIAAAGNLDHDAVVAGVVAGLSGRRGFEVTGAAARPRAEPPLVVPRTGQVVLVDKDTEQAHVVLGGGGLARSDERRFALGVLNNVL